MKQFYDVIVAGAGPAGSTAASYLAKSGHSVLLVDQCAFPRYIVGESMWVATMDLLKMLGVEPDVTDANFIKKIGSTFFWGDIDQPWPVHFTEPDDSLRYAYHVDRMKFDNILLKHAEKLGANTLLSTRLKSIEQHKDFVEAHLFSNKTETVIRGKYLIDATGSGSVFSKNHTKDVLQRPSSLSIWGYFENVITLDPPQDTNGLILRFDNGWIWIFPIKPNHFSVGVNIDPSFIQNINSEHKLQVAFQLALDQCPEAKILMQSASQVEKLKACAFASRNLKKYHKHRVLSIGDAACFIDPILSTGVHLGMLGGCYAARAINTIEAGGNQAKVLDAFDRFYRQDYEEMRKLTDDLIAMNEQSTGSFWQDRIWWKNLSSNSVRTTRRNQIEELSLEKDLTKQIVLQGKHSKEMFLAFGLGKYLQISESNHLLKSLFNPLKCELDYYKGTQEKNCFEPTKVYRKNSSEVYPITEVDLFLLLNANRHTFRTLIQLIRNAFEVEDFSDDDLTMRIGLWIDRKVLKMEKQPK